MQGHDAPLCCGGHSARCDAAAPAPGGAVHPPGSRCARVAARVGVVVVRWPFVDGGPRAAAPADTGGSHGRSPRPQTRLPASLAHKSCPNAGWAIINSPYTPQPPSTAHRLPLPPPLRRPCAAPTHLLQSSPNASRCGSCCPDGGLHPLVRCPVCMCMPPSGAMPLSTVHARAGPLPCRPHSDQPPHALPACSPTISARPLGQRRLLSVADLPPRGGPTDRVNCGSEAQTTAEFAACCDRMLTLFILGERRCTAAGLQAACMGAGGLAGWPACSGVPACLPKQPRTLQLTRSPTHPPLPPQTPPAPAASRPPPIARICTTLPRCWPAATPRPASPFPTAPA